MNIEAQQNPESSGSRKEMNLSIRDSGAYDASELYELPSIAIGLENIVLLEHKDPTKLSVAERGTYVRNIYDAFMAVKRSGENSAIDDRTYVMARWLQEALLVPKRTGSDAVTVREVREVIVSRNLVLGDVMKAIEEGLNARAGRAAIEDDDIEIIRNGVSVK